MGSIVELVRSCQRSHPRIVACSHLLVPIMFAIAWAASDGPSRTAEGSSVPESKSTTAKPPSDGYLGSTVCAGCHAGISRQFSRTSMGRSMSLITPELLQSLPSNASLYDEKHDRHFEV